MARSFFFYSEKKKLLRVKEAHVNYWLLSEQTSYVEVGLLFEMSIDSFRACDTATISVCTPFAIAQGSLTSLFPSLLEDSIATLIFNDEVQSRKALTDVGEPKPCVIAFESGARLLLIDGGVKPLSSNEFVFQLDFRDLEKTSAIDEFEECLHVYVRARYRVDMKSTPSIIHTREFLREKLLVEFRFNEPRALPPTKARAIFKNLIETGGVRVFLIQPCRFNVTLDADSNRRYVRMLEHDKNGWQKYMAPLDHVKGGLTVYHWYMPLTAGRRGQVFDMLVTTEAESRRTMRKLLMALVLGFMAIALLKGPELGNWVAAFGELGVIGVRALKVIGGISGAVMVGVLSSALWDLIKEAYGAARRALP